MTLLHFPAGCLQCGATGLLGADGLCLAGCAPAAAEPSCSECGCSNDAPCVDVFGEPCSWVTAGGPLGAICSFCAEELGW